ncbi:MAG: MOMP family protein, partial [Chlamydiia bacterium]|nr:MOMP family protein [Chlamydiia bacterium]
SPYTEEPVIDLAAGFRYDGWFSADRYHFLLQLGWEHQLWVLHNEVIKASEPDHAGDLVLQGLTLKARFDF